MAQFTNQARLSYNNTVAVSNVAVGEILDALTVTKTAVRDTYSINDSITYIVSIVNSGSVSLTGIEPICLGTINPQGFVRPLS